MPPRRVDDFLFSIPSVEKQMRPSSRTRVTAGPAGEPIIDGLGGGVVPGELGAFGAHPLFERGGKTCASPVAGIPSVIRGHRKTDLISVEDHAILRIRQILGMRLAAEPIHAEQPQ
jgi:hypothetical protein